MREFATSRMPSFVQRLKTKADMDSFLAKADKFGLPKILLYDKNKGSLKPIYKALSTEFRRRVLIGQVPESATDAKALQERFGVTKLPALLAVAAGEGGQVEATCVCACVRGWLGR
jgi:hypothetical protein